MPSLPFDRSLRMAMPLVALLSSTPALAGSATAGSIISKQNAIANATASMPAGNTVTKTNCTTMVRALSARYRCTVYWSPAEGGSGG